MYLALHTTTYARRTKVHSAESEGHTRVFAEGIPRIQLTEDTAEPSVCHRFTLTNAKTFEQFKLKVGWVRLSDLSSDGEMMRRLLVNCDLAGKMRDEKSGQYYYW